MKNLIKLLLILIISYSPNALSEWIRVSEDDGRVTYIDNFVTGKYWIKSYKVLIDFDKPTSIKLAGGEQKVASVVEDKVVDCLFGNLNIRKETFYSDAKANGKSFIPHGSGFSDSTRPKMAYDYRWFQFNREYSDELFKHVCGDIYTLRDMHLFWKIPRQSPM